MKFDGYRTQVIKDADGIRPYTKSGIDERPSTGRSPPKPKS